MSHDNSKINISNSKRSIFLPEDVRKEFGCYVKRPRLDIRLTPSTPHSPNKSVLNDSPKNVIDEVWDDGFPEEEVIEEYDVLITQAYEESITSTKKGDKIGRPTKSAISINETASTSKKVSHGVFNTFNPLVNGLSCGSSAPTDRKNEHARLLSGLEGGSRPSSSTGYVKKTSLTRSVSSYSIIGKDAKKFESENRELKEKIVQKEGEVAILRNQLKQLQSQLETHKLNHCKTLETQAQKFMKQLSEQKKELDVTNTQLQFQIMEATSMRNHCKVLESGTKIKLVDPHSVSAETPKKKKEEQRHASLTTSGTSSPTNSTRSKKSTTERNFNNMLSNMRMKPIITIREGSVFGLLVNEYLTAKSQSDISWILYLRKKQRLCRRIKEAEGINSKILNLQKTNQTLESCYTAVNKLITLDTISSPAASFFIESIVKECQRIVCRQMHILHLLSGVQSYTERGTLNGIVASVIGTAANEKKGLLMDAWQWYEGEEGIESRRALGLLCALCNISSLACDLIYGSKALTNMSEDVTCKMHLPNEGRDVIATSSKFLNTNTFSEVNESCRTVMPAIQNRNRLPYVEYLSKHFGFLHLLRDIAFSICFQRRTRHFVGLLTGIMNLLTAVARNTRLTDEGLEMLSQLIREVVFCRPQLEVIVALFELLAALSCYPVVMQSLCVNSGNNTFVDKRHIGLTYFTRESCVTQVLCRLLPNCTTSLSLRTDLCYHIVDWLYSVICFSSKESCWILAISESKKVLCNCRPMLATGLVTTLYNSLCDLDIPSLELEMKIKLLGILKKGIMLLRVWQQQDKTFFDQDNFAYQLWLSRIEMDLMNLDLSDLEKECVVELIGKSDDTKDMMAEIENEDDEYWNIISNDCKMLFSEQR